MTRVYIKKCKMFVTTSWDKMPVSRMITSLSDLSNYLCYLPSWFLSVVSVQANHLSCNPWLWVYLYLGTFTCTRIILMNTNSFCIEQFYLKFVNINFFIIRKRLWEKPFYIKKVLNICGKSQYYFFFLNCSPKISKDIAVG